MTHGSAASLWMGDLEPFMDEAYLEQLYKGWGYKVVSIRMIRDRASGKPQGYCFLEFENEQMAQEALVSLNLKPWPGTNKLLKLNWASGSNKSGGGGGGGGGRTEDHSVYVGDLSHDVDDNAMFKFFASSYPSCRGAKVVTDYDGRSKGFGFVRFTNEDDAKAAISNFNLSAGLGTNRIRVCKAFPKGQHGQQNRDHHSQRGNFHNNSHHHHNNNFNNHGNNFNNNHGYNNNNHYGGGGYGQFNGRGGGGGGGGGDPWQQYHQQVAMYNQQIQQYQQQYTEAVETEPHGDKSVAEHNAEFLKYDKEWNDLIEAGRWGMVDNILSTRPSQGILSSS